MAIRFRIIGDDWPWDAVQYVCGSQSLAPPCSWEDFLIVAQAILEIPEQRLPKVTSSYVRDVLEVWATCSKAGAGLCVPLLRKLSAIYKFSASTWEHPDAKEWETAAMDLRTAAHPLKTTVTRLGGNFNKGFPL